MRFKSALIALPLLALAAPVAAQDVVFTSGTGGEMSSGSFDDDSTILDDRDAHFSGDGDEEFSGFADRLDDPAVRDGLSEGIERMAGAMMNMRVGPMAEAIERARPGTVGRRIRRDTTIGDLAGRDADYLPERLGDQSRAMMGMMGGFARAMGSMMPEFERMGREMEDSFRSAKAEARGSRY